MGKSAAQLSISICILPLSSADSPALRMTAGTHTHTHMQNGGGGCTGRKRDPWCYLKDSCYEKAFVEPVEWAFPLCEIWAHKDRMLAVIAVGGGLEQLRWKAAPETQNQQFPDSHIRSAMGGISSTYQDYSAIDRLGGGGAETSAEGRIEEIKKEDSCFGLCVCESVTECLSRVNLRRWAGHL